MDCNNMTLGHRSLESDHYNTARLYINTSHLLLDLHGLSAHSEVLVGAVEQAGHKAGH